MRLQRGLRDRWLPAPALLCRKKIAFNAARVSVMRPSTGLRRRDQGLRTRQFPISQIARNLLANLRCARAAFWPVGARPNSGRSQKCAAGYVAFKLDRLNL
jgi:hypothetical protein